MKNVFSHVFTVDNTLYKQISRCNDIVLMECVDEKERKHYEIGKLLVEDGVEFYPNDVISEVRIIKSRQIYQSQVNKKDEPEKVKRKVGRKPKSFFMEIPDGHFTIKELAMKYGETPAYIRSVMSSRGLMDYLKVVGKISKGRGKPEHIYEKMSEFEIEQRRIEQEQIKVAV